MTQIDTRSAIFHRLIKVLVEKIQKTNLTGKRPAVISISDGVIDDFTALFKTRPVFSYLGASVSRKTTPNFELQSLLH